MPEPRARPLTPPQARDGAAARGLAIAMLAAGGGAVIAGATLVSGGGLLAALLGYSLGGTLCAAAGVGGLLLKDVGVARLRSAWSRQGASGRLRRLPS
jgi:hypothetical protein